MKQMAGVLLMVSALFSAAKVDAQPVTDSTASTKKIVMFGNSIIKMGDWEKVLGRSDVVTWGVPGFATGQLIWCIKDVLALHHETKIWFLEGGINDIGLGVPLKRIIENQKVIVDSLKRNNIIPVVQSTILTNGTDANKVVCRLNKAMKKYCDRNGIEYLDLNRFLSKDGEIIMALSIDGCHLRPEAYVPWGEAVKRVLAKYNL